MKQLGDFWAEIARRFNNLPGPVKAAFYNMLAALVYLMIQDLQALQVANKYLIPIVACGVAMLTYLSIYFGSREK